MILNNATFDSAIVNSSLVAIVPSEAINPVVAGGGYMGVGAGAPTLTDVAAPSNSGGMTAPSGAPLAQATAAIQSAGGYFGIPSSAFWLLIFALIGYIILWKVHFSASVGD